MPFDLYSIQKDIKMYLEAQFPQYTFYRNTVPEDEQVPRVGEEVNPFFVVQYGQMYKSTRGGSIAGARNDEYTSWFNLIGMGSVEEDVASSLSLLVDRLIGYKPAGANSLVPDGGPTDYGSRQYSVRPVLYYQSQKFDFTIKQNGMSGHLTA